MKSSSALSSKTPFSRTLGMAVAGVGLVILALGGAFAAFQQSALLGKPVNGAQYPEMAADGRLWVPVYSDNNIKVFESDGSAASFSPVTKGLDPSGKEVKISNPSGIAIYQNIVYVTNDSLAGDRYIFRYSLANGKALPGFRLPYSVGDIDTDNEGHLFVTEKSGHALHILDSQGREIAGSPVALPRDYKNFRGIAVSPDSNAIYVTSEQPGIVIRLRGSITREQASYGTPEAFATNLNMPSAVNLRADGRIYVSEGGNDRVLVYDESGRYLESITGGSPKLRIPRGITFGRDGKSVIIAQYTIAPLQVWNISNDQAEAAATPVSGENLSYVVQVGAFKSQQNALTLKGVVEQLGFVPVIVSLDQTQGLYRVIVGNYKTQEEAEKYAKQMTEKVTWEGFSGSWVLDNRMRSVRYFPLPLVKDSGQTAPNVAVAGKGQVGYWIQIGAYASDQNAKAVKAKIEELGYANIHIVDEMRNNLPLRKVRLGAFASSRDADRVKADLQKRLVFPGLTGNFWVFTAKASEATLAPTLSYRVLVAKFKENLDALKLKATLETQGRYPVFVDENPPTNDVTVGNYPTEAEAQGLLESLKSAGYIDAIIVRASEVASPLQLTSEEKQEISSKQEAAEELMSSGKYLEAIPKLEEIMKTVRDNNKVIQQLQEANKRLTEEQRKRLESEKIRLAEEEDRQNQIKLHHNNALSFWDQGNWDSAIAEWNKVLKLDPQNSSARFFLNEATKRRASLSSEVKSEMEKKAALTRELAQLAEEAQNAYFNKKYDEAAAKYQIIINKDPQSPEGSKAREALSRIEQERGPINEPSTSAEKSELLGMIIKGVIGLAVLGGLIFGIMKLMAYLKSRPKTAKKPKAKPAKKGALVDMIAPPVDASRERELTPEQIEAKKQAEEYYQKGLKAMEAKQWDEATDFFLTAAALDPNNPEPRGKAERVKILKQEEEQLKEAQQKAVSQAETQIIPPPSATEESVPTISIGRPTVAPAPQPPAATPAAETTIISTSITPPPAPAQPAAAGAIFEQSFDDEMVGGMPAGWIGEFAHASLKVSEIAVNNNGKSIMFEKQTGSASTHYRRKFDEAKGKFAVEFDVRCDSKNKYFLGVYIESDEDFRKAVHTVIHTTEDGASSSLRLQGESIPYQLGTWAHVKYILNLADASVDAYVNDQVVIQNARIPGTPEMMNTISIRDNPATTAVMYLDNVRIYPVQ
jgi:tetratricopeptide (TPR) repeat protein/sugar lactone lactonase YvrE